MEILFVEECILHADAAVIHATAQAEAALAETAAGCAGEIFDGGFAGALPTVECCRAQRTQAIGTALVVFKKRFDLPPGKILAVKTEIPEGSFKRGLVIAVSYTHLTLPTIY